MATSPYLTNYGITKDSVSFIVTFDIPDNCDYLTSLDTSGEHIIAVSLQSGEREPAASFKTESVILECDMSGELAVAFELPPDYGDGGSLIKKPRIVVSDLLA